MDKYLKNKKVNPPKFSFGKLGRVNLRFKKDIEPNEVFLDQLAQEKEGDVKGKLELPISGLKFLILGIVFFILFLILFGKTFQFQVLESPAFLNLAKANRERIYQIRPERGIIYDRHMQQLVWNKPSYDLVCAKNDLPLDEIKKKEVIEEVARIFQEDPQVIFKKIDEDEFSEVLISENIPHQVLVILETKIGELSGFRIEKNTVRDYLDPSLSHLIGYLRKISKEDLRINSDYTILDYIGKTGLEESYEKTLRGEPGEIQVEKDSMGKERAENLISEPEVGKGLILSLDFELQKKIVEELKKSMKKVGANRAAAVAMDPNSGGVLAMVSFPDFDNNLFSQGISQKEWEELKSAQDHPFFNRAISGIGYPTGSVIKPLIGLGALEEGIIDSYTKIYCPAQICVWNPYKKENECYKDWTFPQAHGEADIKRAIAESVNTFFYQIGGGYKDFKGLGPEKIIKYLKLFNWDAETGIDLPGEGKGILPEITEDWHLGDTYHLSIGQGPFTATPVEVCVGFSAIANGGKLLHPYLVEKIVNNSTGLPQVAKEIEPRVIKENFVDSQNIEVVRKGMRQAVTSGSAVLLNDLPVAVAAKTGTAQSSKEGYYHHWITVFAPYENPQIVLTIVIEDIKGIQSATLPVAKEVLKWYFTKP